MNRPLRGPQNPTPVDHATDTYDTIDWLVKNVPETQRQGRHPRHLLRRLPAADGARQSAPGAQGVGADEPDGRRLDGRRLVPQRRVPPAEHAVHLRAGGDARERRRSGGRATSTTTTCSCRPGRRASSGRRRGLEQVGFWRKILEHPSYDAFWRDQAVDKLLAAQPLKVPVMLVHSLWDQEDIYGAPAVYKAIEPKDTGNDKVFLVMGPWHHGQEIGDGSALGALRFDSDTALYFRQRDPAAVPRPVPEGRRAEGRRRARSRRSRPGRTRGGGCPRGRRAARAAARSSRRRSISRAGSKLGFDAPKPATRRSTSTSPIRPSRCRSARVRSARRATTTADAGASGSSTTSARRPGRPDVARRSSPTS